MISVRAGLTTAPEEGQLVSVRDRHWIVKSVIASTLPIDPMSPRNLQQHLVELSSVEDDGLGDESSVIWEIEPATRILETANLPKPVAGEFDDPARLKTFLDAVRWGAVTSADFARLCDMGLWRNPLANQREELIMAADPVKVDPKHYTVEFENDKVRVLRIDYPPGEKSTMHGHPNLVAVFLGDGAAKFTYPDGKTEEAEMKAGQVMWFPSVEHLPENVGGKPIRGILVEIK